MYASKRSVAKAQGIGDDRKRAALKNKIAHRGMMKSHIQVTPDGKVIQHYKMDSRTAEFKKAIEKVYAQEKAKKEADSVVEAVTE